MLNQIRQKMSHKLAATNNEQWMFEVVVGDLLPGNILAEAIHYLSCNTSGHMHILVMLLVILSR